MPKTILISGIVRAVTPKAVLVKIEVIDDEYEEAGEFWFPKSQIEELDDNGLEKGDQIDFECPTWLAEEKDLL